VLADFPEPLRSRVAVTPSFENARLPELLAGEEIFVFPSLSEGSSGSLLEAMACGLAPVATAVGTAPDIIDGHNGVLVEPGDTDAVVAAVERLADQRKTLVDVRRRAQETARGFRWDAIAERTLGAYRRALSHRRGT
jgi:glycosyltransferase involved in cell wall biosynthesis